MYERGFDRENVLRVAGIASVARSAWVPEAELPPRPYTTPIHLLPSPGAEALPPLPPPVPQAVFPDSIPRPANRAYLESGYVGPVAPPVERPKPPHLSLVPPLPDDAEAEDYEDVDSLHCEACGRVYAEDESGVFRRNVGEGFHPNGDEN